VFLSVFVFSPLVLFYISSGFVGSTELDKSKGVEVLVNSQTKTVEVESSCDSLAIAIKTLSDWQVASGSYYDPKDTLQTRKGGDGRGAFERMVQSGSIALGSAFTKFFVEEKENIEIFIEIKGLNVITPFGKGIFRLDDKMGEDYSINNSFFLDFLEENLTAKLKRIGRFNVYFRIYKIQKINNLLAAD